MKHVIPTAKKMIVGVVALGALSLGAAGVAGAATPGRRPATIDAERPVRHVQLRQRHQGAGQDPEG